MQEKQITVFVTDDGLEFRTQAEALEYERDVAFGNWYYENPLCDYNDHPVSASKLLSWLLQHKKALLPFLTA